MRIRVIHSRVAALAVGLAVTAFSPSPAAIAAGAPESDAAAILARAKAAAGGAAWDAKTSAHEAARVHAGGLDGKASSVTDLVTGHYVDRFQLGPVSGAEGFDGKVAWSQDASGQSRAEEGDDARLAAVDEAYRRAHAFWYRDRGAAEITVQARQQDGGRTFDVLRIEPAAGRPFDLWLDAATSLGDRIVEPRGALTTTVYLSDYREVDGVRLPFALRISVGDPRYDQQIAVESIQFNQPIAAGAFGMPAPPPVDYTMPAGATSATVPFELYNNHIYVDVKLNGKGPVRVLCDTGGINIVTPEKARELGVKPEGAMQGAGVGEKTQDVGLAKLASLEIGGIVLRDQVFAVFDMAGFDQVEGVPQNGLVGYEVFKRFVVRVDYEHRTLTLTVPAAFSYHGDGVVVPFKFNEHIPQVDGSIDGIAGVFDIDTGSRTTLDLLGPFVAAHDLHAHYAPKLAGVTGWGVGGAARSELARAEVLKLGGVEFRRPVVELSLQKQGAFANRYVAGNVGAGLLKLYTVTFDYSRQQIIFERTAASDQPAAFDRCGAWLNVAAGGGAYEVLDVYAGSPAAEGGLRNGDRIVAVDGRGAAQLNLPALRDLLRTGAPGTKVTFTVDRAGHHTDVTVVLRDLV